MEKYLVFRAPDGKELCAYTLRGTFPGEAQSTRELLAYEQRLDPADIQTAIENRNPQKRKEATS